MDKIKSQSSVSGKPPAAARAAQPQTLVTKPTRSLAGAPLVALVAFVALAGCATMIPPADDTPPRLELTIIGPGLGTRTMTNPPQARWSGEGGSQLFDLLPDTGYNFRLVVSDAGGAARAHLRMPREFTVSNLSPAAVREEVDALQRSLTLLGSRDDPRTGLIIAGRFRTQATGILVFDFAAEGDDFGGTPGRRNQTFMIVQVGAGAGRP
jgi:hypothetical protein